jgi:hypothetical protein
MNGKHASGCNCADCLEYLESESLFDLDQWMPNHEDISGMLCSALSADDVCSRVTHGQLPFEDAQLNRSHQGPDLSLRINNSRTPLETNRGDGNGDRRVADRALPPCTGGYLVDGGDKVRLTQTVRRHELRGRNQGSSTNGDGTLFGDDHPSKSRTPVKRRLHGDT